MNAPLAPRDKLIFDIRLPSKIPDFNYNFKNKNYVHYVLAQYTIIYSAYKVPPSKSLILSSEY